MFVTKKKFCRRPSEIQKWMSDELHIICTHLECIYGECHVTKIHQLVQPLQPKDCAVQVYFCHLIAQNYYFMLDTNIPKMLEYFIKPQTYKGMIFHCGNFNQWGL